MSFSGVIPIEPQPKERPRFSRKTGRAYTPINTRQFEAMLIFQLKKLYKRPPMDGPLEAVLVFYLPKKPSIPKKRIHPHTKPDLDNLCKAFYDAAEKAGIFVNDSRVVKQTHTKRYAEVMGPRIQFEIKPYLGHGEE